MSFPLNFEELKRQTLSGDGAYFAMARLIERGFWFSADYVQQSSRFLVEQSFPYLASRIIFKAADHYWDLYKQELENQKFHQRKYHTLPPESSTLNDTFTQAESFYEQGIKILIENLFSNEGARAVEKVAGIYEVLAREHMKTYQLVTSQNAYEKLEKLPVPAKQQKAIKNEAYKQAKKFLDKSILYYEKAQNLFWQGGMHSDALRISMQGIKLKIEASKFQNGVPKTIKYCIKMGYLQEASQLYQLSKDEAMAKKMLARYEERRKKIMQKKMQADEILSSFQRTMKQIKSDFSKLDKQVKLIENPGFFKRWSVFFMKRRLKKMEIRYQKTQQKLKKSAEDHINTYFDAKELGRLQELSYDMEWHDKTFENIAQNLETQFWANHIVNLFTEFEKLKAFKQEIVQKQVKNLMQKTVQYMQKFDDLISSYKDAEKQEMALSENKEKSKPDKFKKVAKMYESKGLILQAMQSMEQAKDEELVKLYRSLLQINETPGR